MIKNIFQTSPLNTKKGKTILNPRVPVKLVDNKGKSGTFLFIIATIYVK